jgi:diaminopimelate decarboxylase
LNESVYHTFNCVIMDDVSLEGKNQFYSKVGYESLERSEICEKKISTLFGMTCDGMDVIAKNAFVPVEMNVGDWLCVSGMGAYTYGSRTEFNGMKSIEKIIKWSVRVDENYLDLVQAVAL